MAKTNLRDIIGSDYTKLGFFREVQEKMAELRTYNIELEEKKQEIQDILNGIMDVLAVISPDYHIIYVNKVFHDYFDIVRPQGLYCYDVFRGRDEPCPGRSPSPNRVAASCCSARRSIVFCRPTIGSVSSNKR